MSQAQNRRALAILCIRDEGALLLDWLAHHQAVGFTDFLVFTNDCQDGSDAMAARLQALGLITHIDQQGPFKRGPQWAALNQVARHPLWRSTDWAMVLDIDEYVNIHQGAGRLADLWAALPQARAIALTWRLFGNAGQIFHRDLPPTAVFHRAAPGQMLWPWRASMYKTLFSLEDTPPEARLALRPGVHRPRLAQIAHWYDGAGAPLPPGYRRPFTPLGRPAWGLAQLNHYALGSLQSYLLKAARGRANRDAAPHDLSYWVERNFNTEEDRSIARLAPKTARARAALAQDAVLADLHQGALAWRQARFNALMAEDDWRDLFGRLMLVPGANPLSAERQALILAHAHRALAQSAEGREE